MLYYDASLMLLAKDLLLRLDLNLRGTQVYHQLPADRNQGFPTALYWPQKTKTLEASSPSEQTWTNNPSRMGFYRPRHAIIMLHTIFVLRSPLNGAQTQTTKSKKSNFNKWKACSPASRQPELRWTDQTVRTPDLSSPAPILLQTRL